MKRKSSIGKAVAFVALVMIAMIGVRALASSPQDLLDRDLRAAQTDVEFGPQTEWFSNGMNGDGSTFAVMAADPLGLGPGLRMNKAAFRYTRFGYSWLSGSVSLFQERFTLLGLSLVGLASVAGLALLAFNLNERLGPWAWLLIVNPALALGFLGDTAEPLALLLISISLSGLIPWAGSLVAVVRPSYLLALVQSKWVFVVGVAIAVVSRVIWVSHIGGSLFEGSLNLGFPFQGILDAPSFTGWIVVIAGAATLVIGVLRRDFAWVSSGLLVLAFSSVVYESPDNAMRAAGMLPVLWAFGPRLERVRNSTSSLRVGGVSSADAGASSQLECP